MEHAPRIADYRSFWLQARGGFTLVETLIVAIMLAILAVIIVPTFQGTSKESQLAAVEANLTTLRKAIDLYYYEHGHYPGAVKSEGTCSAGINTETATPGAAAFVAHLTQYSTKSGVACSQSDANSRYGPYLRKIPVNPLTGSETVTAIHTGSLVVRASDEAADSGWIYDFVAGRIRANRPSAETL